MLKNIYFITLAAIMLISCNKKFILHGTDYVVITEGYIVQQGNFKWFLPYSKKFKSTEDMIVAIDKQKLLGVGLSHIYVPNKLNSNFYTTILVSLPNGNAENIELEIYPCTLFTIGPIKIESEIETAQFIFKGQSFDINYTMDLGEIFYKFEARNVY